jgi:hypothetical protein
MANLKDHAMALRKPHSHHEDDDEEGSNAPRRVGEGQIDQIERGRIRQYLRERENKQTNRQNVATEQHTINLE